MQGVFNRVIDGLGFRTSVTITTREDGVEVENLNLHLPRWVKWCPPVRWWITGPLFDHLVADMKAHPAEWA
jgi:hypothetical protein